MGDKDDEEEEMEEEEEAEESGGFTWVASHSLAGVSILHVVGHLRQPWCRAATATLEKRWKPAKWWKLVKVCHAFSRAPPAAILQKC